MEINGYSYLPEHSPMKLQSQINYTPADLIAFEAEVAERYNNGEFGSGRIHLHSGGEEHLIEVFRNIQPEDWCVVAWRNHYHCLLKGVSKEEIFREITTGNSIHPQFPEHRIVSSAIVGGGAPIAVGIALGIQLQDGTNRVHCFLGDMAAETGIVHESIKYARNFQLPITWHIEDNNSSVNDKTSEVWGREQSPYAKPFGVHAFAGDIDYYTCPLGRYPHGGSGKWLQLS